MSASGGRGTLASGGNAFHANDRKEEYRRQDDQECPTQPNVDECQWDGRRIGPDRDPNLSEHSAVERTVELVPTSGRCMESQQREGAGAHHYDKSISRRRPRGTRVQAEKARNDRHHRDPEEDMIIQPERGAVAALQCRDQIMMVGPKDSHHHKGQRVDCEQGDELLERHRVIREGKAVRNANFEDNDRDGDGKHAVRKAFDPSVVRMKLERRVQVGIAVHFRISVSRLPLSAISDDHSSWAW